MRIAGPGPPPGLGGGDAVIRLLLVEDHRLVAQALEMGLRAEGVDVRCTEGAPDTLPALLADFPPDVVLLDLYLADRRSGIDLLPLLKGPQRKVILVTGESDPSILARALEAGVDAVVEKAVPVPELVAEVTAVARGRSPLADARRQQILRQARRAEAERRRLLAPFATLTPREQAVFLLLIDGVRAVEIATRSYVSLSTVRAQIRSILTKVGARSQLEAVAMAVKAGWERAASSHPRHF
jgi:two-component system nitrate/nitrite response regulator NarL